MIFSVTAHEPIKNYVDYQVRSSGRPDILPSFNGEETIHYFLYNETEVFLDIQLSEQTLISGLQFSMSDDKAIEIFSLSVREWGVQFPDDYTFWGTHKLHYGELPLGSSPITKKRTIQFQPIMGDRLKIYIDKGGVISKCIFNNLVISSNITKDNNLLTITLGDGWNLSRRHLGVL